MIDDPTDLGDGSEISVGGAAGADDGGGGTGAGEGKGAAGDKRMTFKEAMDVVRQGVKATPGAADPARAGDPVRGAGAGDDDGAGEGAGEGEPETAEQLEERLAGMSEEERTAELARLDALAAEDPLVVDLGALREGEEPIRIQAADQAMADQLRSLTKRAASYETALRIRDEASAYVAQADELRYGVQLDPSGFLLDNLKGSPNFTADAAAIARVLVTQPGVFDLKIANDGTTFKDWLVALAEHPEAIPQEARLANADRLDRKAKAEPLVQQMKFENKNARDCVKAAYSEIESAMPDWEPAQHNQFVNDIVRDLQDLQTRENVRVTDPKRVKVIVERRLKAFGVAPKAASAAGRGGNGRSPGKTGQRTSPSGQQLVATDTARRRAAGPGPGAGSPAAGIPRPPAGTKLTGKGNVFQYIREHLPALRRAPR